LIALRDIGKDFDGVHALRGVNLHINRGETFGLIGPNGAGKTTLVRILSGQIAPTSGQIILEGKPVDPRDARYRLRIGLVPQEPSFYGRLTARENLDLLASLYGLERKEARERVEELLEWSGLKEHADRQVRYFSRGMQQRLSLAMGLVHRPELVFLDEPTSGLDPEARSSVWQLMGSLSREGKTVLVTTHNMEEADRVCDRLAILVRGMVREEGTPQRIKGLLGADRVEVRLGGKGTEEIEDLCRRLDLQWRKEGELVILTGAGLPEKLAEITSGLAGRVRGLHYREVTLEDAFLRFMREVGD